MITDAILSFFTDLLDAMFGWIEIPDVPAWVSNPSAISVVFQFVGSMGIWFPTATVVLIIGAIFAARLLGLAIKSGRMVLSLLTGGGGHAGG